MHSRTSATATAALLLSASLASAQSRPDIDQSRRHIILGGIYNDARVRGWQIGANARNLAACHGDVEAPVPMIGRVDDVAILQQEVVDLLTTQRQRKNQKEQCSHGITW